MTQELKKKETTELTTPAAAPITINKKDLLLPKLLLLQGSSALVNEGKFVNGDIINSLTEEKLGDKTKQIEILPISYYSTWTVLEKGSGKFVGSIPYQEGKELPYDGESDDGRAVNNYYTINVYALLVKELEQGAALPVLISFRSKSLTTGKRLITSHFLFCQMHKAPAYAKSVFLGCTYQKNDKGSFHIFSIALGKKATPEQMAAAQMWESTLRGGDVKIDEKEETDAPVVDTSSTEY
jgi:hypothetical protein